MKGRKRRAGILLASSIACLILLLFAVAFVAKHRRDAIVHQLTASPEFIRARQAIKHRNDTLHVEAMQETAPSDPSPAPPHLETDWKNWKDDKSWKWVIARDDLVAEVAEEDWASLQDFLTARAAIIAQLQELAAKGQPWFELHLEDGVEMRLPDLGMLRDFGNLLVAQAALEKHLGNSSEAVATLLVHYQYAEILAGEPVLMLQSLRQAMHATNISMLCSLFEPGELTTEQAIQLQQVYQALEFRPMASQVLTFELQSGLDMFRSFRAAPIHPKGRLIEQFAEAVYKGPLGAAWAEMDEAAFASFYGEYIEASKQTYFEARERMIALEAESRAYSIWHPLSNVFRPSISVWLRSTARAEAMRDLAVLGLKIEEHFRQPGHYAEAPEALSTDPFSGTHYHFQPANNGFTLYSVGVDGIDDGGAPETDIVWRHFLLYKEPEKLPKK